jgi:hypothetical protein
MPTKQPKSGGSAAAFLAQVRQLELLDAPSDASWDEAVAGQQFPDAVTAAKHLVRRGLLTLYQANEVLHGRGHALQLGQLLSLATLGPGRHGSGLQSAPPADAPGRGAQIHPQRAVD